MRLVMIAVYREDEEFKTFATAYHTIPIHVFSSYAQQQIHPGQMRDQLCYQFCVHYFSVRMTNTTHIGT
jgi:hypothetical protein